MRRELLERTYQRTLSVLPRRTALIAEYVVRCRRPPRFRHPSTYTEKVLWRRLNDGRPELAVGCNKLTGKDFAAERLSGHGVRFARTLFVGAADAVRTAIAEGVAESVTGWVLKPVALGGGLVMFGSGNVLDEAQFDTFLKRADWGRSLFRKIGGLAWGDGQNLFMIEERLGSNKEVLQDFKVHVFGGRATHLVVYSGRDLRLTGRCFDLRTDLEDIYRESGVSADIIARLIGAAEDLARELDYMRVDFYIVDSDIYFGELTPYPNFAEAERSRRFDTELGRLWDLATRT